MDISIKIQSACQVTNYQERLELSRKAKLKMLKDIEKIRRLIKECQGLSRPGKSTIGKMKKLKSTERSLINSIRQTPYISLPNVDIVKKAMEMVGDASNIDETNLVARYIYDSVETTCKEVIDIIKAAEFK